MKHIRRIASIWLLLLVLCTILLFVSCASIQKGYHQFIMRGSIVDISGSDVYLCIGSKDGAAVGQELNVYKIVRKVRYNYERQLQGKVRIEVILDEHFARATVISGKAERNDIVELVRP